MCGSVSFHPISPYAIQSKKNLFIALSFMDSNVISCRLLFRFFSFIILVVSNEQTTSEKEENEKKTETLYEMFAMPWS